MPVYEYQCSACQHEFEREQRISEDPVKKCPKCGKLKVKRLISRTSFVLKGGGWYGDLYGSVKPGGEKKDEAPKDAAASASDASNGESPAAAPSEGKTGAKPDAKKEKKSPSKKKAAAA
ncbi:MAG TPA: zinc ribbon domain-containing protein [Myxococcota bacterium]|jgi:putative FmdB family regulatory protein